MKFFNFSGSINISFSLALLFVSVSGIQQRKNDAVRGWQNKLTHLSRRDAALVVASVPYLLTKQARAAVAADATSDIETVLLRGRVTLGQENDMNMTTSEGAALYITCRPRIPDDVPSAILNGSRGKPPPVLAARLVDPIFPLEFELSSPRDLTIEGATDGSSPGSTVLDPTRFWWKDSDLIVSLRLDTDGIAATRSPDDLVGRGLSTRAMRETKSAVSVQLTGRGAFGKLVTGGSSSPNQAKK